MSQVYDNHRALADGMICDALSNTDSPTEKLDILKAHRDALAVFSIVPIADAPVPAPKAETDSGGETPPRKAKKAATTDQPAPDATAP